MAQGVSDNLTVFILAAGIGSRLGKLTEDRPKALVQVNRKPMINSLIDKLILFGFSNFAVNLHHHGEMLKNHLINSYPNIEIVFSDEQNLLLDTGGAIVKAKPILQNTANFLVHNVDIVLPFNPCDMLSHHLKHNALITLAVSMRKSTRNLIFDLDNKLCGWINNETGEIRKAKNYRSENKILAYSGVQWVSTEYFELEKRTGPFGIIDSWLDICHIKPIIAFEHPVSGWFDLGTEAKIGEAEKSGTL